MFIYKVLRAQEWADLVANGVTHGAPVDISDGFVHFSTAAQLGETLRRHFGGDSNLMCVCVRAGGLGSALVWEVSRGNALFPHLYGPLKLDHVVWAHPIPDGPDGHVLPEDVT